MIDASKTLRLELQPLLNADHTQSNMDSLSIKRLLKMIPMKKTLALLCLSLVADAIQAGSYTYNIVQAWGLSGPYYDLRSFNNKGQAVGNVEGSGFIYDSGIYKKIDAPGAVASNIDLGTRLTGINDSGQIVGYYSVDAEKSNSFAYINNAFIPINVPNSLSTFALGIANNGLVVGSFDDLRGTHNFVFNGSNYQVLPDIPNSNNTGYLSINSNGTVAGTYYPPNSYFSHGFIYKNNQYATINYPNAASTSVAGINDSGQIVGSTDSAGNFIYDGDTYSVWARTLISATGLLSVAGINNQVTAIVPGYLSTIGINNNGVVLGESVSDPLDEWFTATPSTQNSPCHPNVIYNFWSHEIVMQDVLVGDIHYYAKLNDQGDNNFKLTDTHPVVPGTCPASEVIEYVNNAVTIPSVLAYGNNYNITLEKNKDNDLFTLKNYSINPPVAQ